MTPEGKVQAYLRKRITEAGGHHRKLEWTGRRGAPDLFVWWDGPHVWFVEVKSATGRLTPLQSAEHARLRASGFRVRVVSSLEEADAFVAEAAQ